jgi:sugar phosphate isomerase/epimerase
MEECMELVGSLGPGQGVELVGPQMIRGFPELPEEFEKRFKRAVEKYDLRPTTYGAYADPQRITGRLLNRKEQIEYLKVQMRAAKKLGFSIVRVSAVEPVFSELVEYAQKLGLKLGIEIHAPMMIETMQDIIERVKKVNSPHLGFVPDCGTFCHSCFQVYIERFRQQGVPPKISDRILQLWKENAPDEAVHAEVDRLGGDKLAHLMATESQVYFGHSDPKSMLRIMPYIIHVHGKFHGIDEAGRDTAVRFPEVVSVLKRGGYTGYISCEYEGHHWAKEREAFAQIKAVQNLIRRCLENPTQVVTV